MSLREAAQQALEALEEIHVGNMTPMAENNWNQAMSALRAALSDTQDWDEVEALRASLREHMAEIHRLREAGRQALGAMDDLHRTGDTQVFDMYGCEATEALRAALEPVTDCHEKEGDKLSPPSDHVPDADKIVASVRESRTVEPVAYVTGYSKGYATVRPVDPCLLMCVGMALYRSPPTISKTETVEPVACHPVAWLQIGVGDHEGTAIATTTKPKTWNPDWWRFEPLYTAPPKRKPLTDEEIESCIDEDFDYALDRGNISNKSVIRFARAVIAKATGGEE